MGYKDVVDFAYAIEQNHLPAQKKYHELALNYWKGKGYNSVIVLPDYPHCCKACLDSIPDIAIPIEEALRRELLPHSECTGKPCRCEYEPVDEDD